MKNLFLLCLTFLSFLNCKSQSFLFTDIGNSILLRPNIGYEYRWKNKGFSTNIQWQRNATFYLTEIPEFRKVNGIRADFVYKYFFNKHGFLETKVRTQYYDAPFLVDGWHIASLYNSNRSIEIAQKIGYLMNINGRFQFDFSLGAGLNFGTKPLQISNTKLYDAITYRTFSEEELKTKFKNPNKVAFSIIPHAQMRVFYQLKSK